MKSEMRRSLARESFEEKIRKVGQLIHLVKLARQKTANSRRGTIRASTERE